MLSRFFYLVAGIVSLEIVAVLAVHRLMNGLVVSDRMAPLSHVSFLVAFVIALLIAWKWRQLELWAACVAGGAASNLIISLLWGDVVDYIHLLNLSVINVADIWITIGLLGMAFVVLRHTPE